MAQAASEGLLGTAVTAGQRWSGKEAGAVLDRLDASGLTVAEFATRAKLDAWRLYRWRQKLGRTRVSRRVRRAKQPTFVEIRATAPVAVEVVLRSGHVLRVPDGFGEEQLRRLIAVLDHSESPC
jgi:hypothetical protein